MKPQQAHTPVVAPEGVDTGARISKNRARPFASYPAYQQVSGKKQLEEVIDLLFRRRWIILLCFLLVAGATVAYTVRQVPQYSASSIVMVDLGPPTAPTVQLPGTENSLFATGNRTLSGELFIIENSYEVSRRVSERLRSMQEAAVANGELAEGERIFPPRGHTSYAAASPYVSAIRVTASSPDPEEAARLANIYAEEYVGLTREANRAYMTTSREYLEEQEAKRRSELQQVEERLTRHLSSGGGLGLDPTGSAVVSQISTLESQRDAAVIDLQMRSSSLQVIEREMNQISPQLAQRLASDLDQRLAAARTRLAALEGQKKDILLYYGADQAGLNSHNELPGINRQIDALQDEIAQLSASYVNEVTASGGVLAGETGIAYVTGLKQQAVQAEIEMDALKAQIDVLNRYIAEKEGELRSIPGQSLEYARLERERQHAEQMYAFVVSRLQETRISEESEPGYAHVLREAGVPSNPVSPDKPKNIILGLFFGLLAGLGIAVVRDKLDNRIYKPDDLTNSGYSVIGTVPDMTALIKEDHKGEEFIELEGQRYSTSLVSLVNPLSTVAETYRQLRTRIQFSRPDVVVQTILVSSSSPGEGKTVTASNLAVTMAQAGRRTLLIDADLRRPRVHEVWGLKPSTGLIQMLFGAPGVDVSTFRTAVDNLYVMPAGGFDVNAEDDPGSSRRTTTVRGDQVITNPAEILGSRRMRDLLTTLREEFDVIIIDSPPVLAASDAVLLSTQADATIVVVRASKTKEGEVETVVDELDSVGATVIGVLLNGFDVSMAYGRKYRYQHYSKYGPYAKYGYYAATPKS